MTINQFTIIGNLTRDPELRYTPAGMPKAFFTVAVNETYIDEDGKRQSRVDFFPIFTFGKQAENDSRYLRKGSPVAITGKMRSWRKDDKSGFAFEPLRFGGVNYLGKINGASTTPDAAPGQQSADQSQSGPMDQEMQEWVRDYDNANSAAPMGAQRH